jgi:hypothetical protein
MSWKGASYRQSALIPACDAPELNRALIIHAIMHDQDQRLTGRYHNTNLRHKLNINLNITNQGHEDRTRIQQSANNIVWVQTKLNKFALRRLSKTTTRSKRRRPPAWGLRTTPSRRSPHSSRHRRGSPAPGLRYLNAATGLGEKVAKQL